jgi:hypothetical protein
MTELFMFLAGLFVGFVMFLVISLLAAMVSGPKFRS